MSQPAVREPGIGAIVVAEITITRDQRVHAGGLRRLHVALGVAHVHAFGRRDPWLRRVQQRQRDAALRSRQRVAADHGTRARVQAQLHQQRIGEPAGLVGDDAPVQAAPLERRQHFVAALEQAGVSGELLR